jgi:hypothetical protein
VKRSYPAPGFRVQASLRTLIRAAPTTTHGHARVFSRGTFDRAVWRETLACAADANALVVTQRTFLRIELRIFVWVLFSMGKMISLQAIAPSPRPTTGMSLDDQSKLFRFTLKHSVKLAASSERWRVSMVVGHS